MEEHKTLFERKKRILNRIFEFLEIIFEFGRSRAKFYYRKTHKGIGELGPCELVTAQFLCTHSFLSNKDIFIFTNIF